MFEKKIRMISVGLIIASIAMYYYDTYSFAGLTACIGAGQFMATIFWDKIDKRLFG